MEQEIDNGLYYDGHDLVNAFMWGAVAGAFVAVTLMVFLLDRF